MNINQNFLIKIGGTKFCILNTSIFSNINNPNDGSWIWISLGMDFYKNELFWSIMTKNHLELIYNQITFPFNAFESNFTLLKFDLVVGGNTNYEQICYCKMNYFTYYHNEFVTKVEGIPDLIPKPISIHYFH